MFFEDSTYYYDGTSEVIVKHRGKRYCGFAYLHPDDKDKASEFTGCRYAETRAMIRALKDEYKQKKAACEECRKFVASVQQYAKFNAEDPSAKAMFRQLNRRIKEVNNLADEINELELSLNISIRQRDVLMERMKNKLEKLKND